MYLKSLVLKGFKSFADRSALTLEPGITAVVGPNGSGKSNISDAVLWVLGERSARNLRGQTMEDIIFAGSSARKPVSVAEVELVLDNTDGTLPVDFDEVSIMRRVYRNGESEYLINGVVSRRMDVLELLHDTGLGTGTHSIISQGSLDSILRSKPEDRRALIEEAAGVLKHKERKEKSARKIEKMNNHVERVRDVANEVERQLKPLERKAKKAAKYQEASAELAEVKLALAVDDLRKLQKAWNEILEKEEALSKEIDSRKEAMATSEQKVTEIQNLIRKETQGAGELARKQREISSVAERLYSSEMLLREKHNAARDYEADLRISLQNSTQKIDEAKEELQTANQQLEQATAEFNQAEEVLAKAEKEFNEKRSERREQDKLIDELATSRTRIERERDSLKHKYSDLQQDLSSGIARKKLLATRLEGLQDDVAHAQKALEEKTTEAQEAQKNLEALATRESEARVMSRDAFDNREKMRLNHAEVEDKARVLASDLKSARKTQRAQASGRPAYMWLLDNRDEFEGDITPLAQLVGAPSGMERLVELLLGEDVSALAVQNDTRAFEIVDTLMKRHEAGDVSLVYTAQKNKQNRALVPKGQQSLIESLSFSESSRDIIEALLGDVIVCNSTKEAFDAARNDEHQFRYVTREGCVVYPEGKASIYGASSDAQEGVLALERRIEDIEKNLALAEDEVKDALDLYNKADSAYKELQKESLKLSQDLARQRGIVTAAESEKNKADLKVKAVRDEYDSLQEQANKANESLDALRPRVEELQVRIKQLDESWEKVSTEHAQATERVIPLRREAGRLNEAFSQAKLNKATLAERKLYASRMVDTRKSSISKIEDSTLEAREMIARKKAAQLRANPVLQSLEVLQESLHVRMRSLDDLVAVSENTSTSFEESARSLREQARTAREEFDSTSAQMTQTRVEKGRLELQVDTAVHVVIDDCNTPIDNITELPMLENRKEREQELFQLERRIKNMGTVNPDAAKEYEQVKQRYDYLQMQLNDVDQACKSLKRIVSIIDSRMKNEFITTYEQVNRDFGEIFSILFPGGSAKLVLVDPDDLEHTGVEVEAQPRGKRIRNMTLMSGGEKSLTALALLFAVYRMRSTPFYILDEVEAALDDTNLRRLSAYINGLRHETQLIMITHQRRTMEMADVLFGVSMQSDGVTNVISQKLEHALKHAE